MKKKIFVTKNAFLYVNDITFLKYCLSKFFSINNLFKYTYYKYYVMVYENNLKISKLKNYIT